MQRGSLAVIVRKDGPAVWQFRWSEKDLHGVRVQRKRVIGSIERYPDETAARSAITVLLAEINSDKVRWAPARLQSGTFVSTSSSGNWRRTMPGAVTRPRRLMKHI